MTARNQTYRKIALALAFLVFISTTGVGMQAHWCGCISQWSLKLLPSTESSCCQANPKLNLAAHSCCAEKLGQSNQNVSKDDLICAAPTADNIKQQDCCYEVFKYAKGDLIGQITFSEILPVVAILPTSIYFSPTIETTLPSLWQEGQIKSIPNKAPPRFGNNYRHWIQVYRC